MLLLRELTTHDNKIINEIVSLHIRAFPSFFLTQLGRPFLKTLYAAYLNDEGSGIIVAEDHTRIVGFLAYSKDYSRFYRELIKHHLITFALCSIKAAICHPSFIMRLLRAFQKSESVKREDQYIELSSICVDPKLEGNGIATRLIDFLKSISDFNRYAYINLETDAVNNQKANAFYQKNGFTLARQFVTKEKRIMNEYRYYKD